MVAEDIEAKTREWNWSPSLELPPSEIRAIRLLADGLTEGQAATKAGVALETMKQQRKDAYRRLGARNGPHAVAIAMRQGILA